MRSDKEKVKKDIILPGDYIAGFVDGEGCFYLTYRSEKKWKRKGQPIYYRWVPYFAIVLRKDDREILGSIQNTIGCGIISESMGTVRYNVQNVDAIIKIIIPFFKKYPLHAKKKGDFELWSKAADLIYKKFHNKQKYNGALYSEDEHKKLFYIRNQMKDFKSKRKGEYKHKPL